MGNVKGNVTFCYIFPDMCVSDSIKHLSIRHVTHLQKLTLILI